MRPWAQVGIREYVCAHGRLLIGCHSSAHTHACVRMSPSTKIKIQQHGDSKKWRNKILPMSESSDSDVIHRTRIHKKVRPGRSEHVFSSEESESPSLQSEAEYDTFFHEIFGTGDEYSYIYKAAETAAQTQEPSDRPYSSRVIPSVNPMTCLDYVRSRLPAFAFSGLSLEIIRNILDGYSPEYISLYCDGLKTRECYYISDLVDEFREYSQIQSPRVDSLRAFRLYKGEEKAVGISGLLDISQYMANMMAWDRKFEPVGEVVDELMTEEEVKQVYLKAINQIANNPVFQDRVNLFYEFEMLSKAYDKTAEVGQYKSQLYSLYQTDQTASGNRIRWLIIDEAIKRVTVNRREIETRLKLQGYLRSEKSVADGQLDHRSPLTILDNIQDFANFLVSVRGPTGKYAGIFHDKGFCQIVLVDEAGNLTNSAVFREMEQEHIRKYVTDTVMVCITSSTPNVKHLVGTIGISLYYVPSYLSFFSEYKEYSIALNIALLVQNPFVYFARLFQQAGKRGSFGGIPALNNGRMGTHEHSIEIVRRGIKIALGCAKMDWKHLHSYKYGHVLFQLLDIKFDDQYFDYGNVESLEKLSTRLGVVGYSNACTYFVLADSPHPLDGTPVHPKDYSMATVVCKGAYNLSQREENIPDDKIISWILENKQLIRELRLPDDQDVQALRMVRGVLLAKELPYFSGATDRQVFEDVVRPMEESVQATICKVGRDFYLADCDNMSIYIRKTGGVDYFINQRIQVKIVDRCYHMLNYLGEIEEEEPDTAHLIKHPLFRNLDQGALQARMETESKNVMIKSSSQKDHVVVLCRLQSGIFYGLRLKCEFVSERSSRFYYGYHRYDSIDNFLNSYVRELFQLVHLVKKFKYFFRTYEEAAAHIGSGGEYRRYAICFSRSNPGYLDFLYSNKRVCALLDGKELVYRDHRFLTLEEFLNYAKVNFK